MSYNSNTGVISITPATQSSPQEGISIYDIQRALGLGQKDIGGLITQGAAQGKINPWAMFKPVRDSSWRWVNRPYSSVSQGVSLSSLGFGNPPYATSIQGLLNYYATAGTLGGKPSNGWEYLAPRGKTGSILEPFRMFDFGRVVDGELVAGDGYCAKAVNPFGTFRIGTQSVSIHSGQVTAYQTSVSPVTGAPDTYVTITDFNTILSSGAKMLYYGVLFVPEHNDYAYKIVGNNTPIADNETVRGCENMALESFLLDDESWNVEEYTAYPFLMNTAIGQSRIISKNYSQRNDTLTFRMYPLAGVIASTLNVFEFYIAINVSATTASGPIDGKYNTTAYYTIKNNYATSVTITNLEMKLRKTNSWTATRQTGEVFYTKAYRTDDSATSGVADNTYAEFLADITLAAGEEKTIPGVGEAAAVILPNSDTNTIFIGCVVNGLAQYGQYTVRMPAPTDGGGLEIVEP